MSEIWVLSYIVRCMRWPTKLPWQFLLQILPGTHMYKHCINSSEWSLLCYVFLSFSDSIASITKVTNWVVVKNEKLNCVQTRHLLKTPVTNMTRFAKRVLYTQSFKSHFLPWFDGYKNRLTVHVYTIVRCLTVWFYCGLIHKPAWCPQVFRWSLNGSNLNGQADSWQRITTRLAGETEHWCNYILWHMGLHENSLNWEHLAA